jgi:hypothetical protein
MGPESIVRLHRASKTATLLWFALRRRGMSAWWLLAVAVGMFIAVRVLLIPYLYAAGWAKPWR